MIGIQQLPVAKSILLGGWSLTDTKLVPTQVSKTPNDFVDQLQDLEELYQELLALRMRVRRAEHANEKYANVGPKTKASSSAGRKQLADKRAG
jgi:hypothetical protein